MWSLETRKLTLCSIPRPQEYLHFCVWLVCGGLGLNLDRRPFVGWDQRGIDEMGSCSFCGAGYGQRDEGLV